MPKLVRNSSAVSRSGDRSRPYARSVTLMMAIAVSSCVETLDMLDHRPFLSNKPGGEYRRRRQVDSAPHEAVVGRRDPLDQLRIDRGRADRAELHADASVGLTVHQRLHGDAAAVAAQGSR